MVEKLSALTQKALESPDLKATYLKQGATPLWLSPADTAAHGRSAPGISLSKSERLEPRAHCHGRI